MKIIANPMESIMAINPTAEVSIEANDINKITWLNGTTPIPKADIEAKRFRIGRRRN